MARTWFTSFMAIFVAMDVVGMLPITFQLTERMQPRERRRVIDLSIAVALGVALGFAFLGQAVFRFMGIDVADFRVAGGLVLLLLSLADLVGRPEHESRITGSSGVVPLAVPLISGPAVLTTIILHVDVHGPAITLTALLANIAIAWALMRRSGSVFRMLGRDGSVVASKLVALLLAAFAVSMIRGGLSQMISGGN